MAIASFFVLHASQDMQAVHDFLGRLPYIVAVAPVETEKTAAAIELPGKELPSCLKKISALPQILALELVFANYEDDLDAKGHMPAGAEKYG